MDVVKTIRPSDPGSQRFLVEWGERLVAVRYRKPADGRRILTTIEVIVDERAHRPGVNQRGSEAHRRAQAVAVRIPWQETDLREKVKATGARWSPSLKLWLMRRNQAIALGVADRIVEGAAEQCEDVDVSYQI